MGRIVRYQRVANIDLTTAHGSYTEVARISTAGGDSIKLRIKNGGTGGTGLSLQLFPCWDKVATPVSEPLYLGEANDTGLATAMTSIPSGDVRIFDVVFGNMIQQSNRSLPPFISFQIQEDHTGGTFEIDEQLVQVWS